MKKFFCIAALLGFINHSFAQNSNPWPTTGNVGIGTASPTTALQVVGDIRFGSNTAYTDLKIANQTPLTGYNQTNILTPLTAPGSGTAKAALYLKNAGSAGITRMDLLVDGNVGIGTTTPVSKLQVGVPAGVTTAALSNDVNIFGTYSATRGNLNIGTNDAASADKGGMLTFSGESGQTSSPYYFGGIRGAKEGVGTYQGYLAFYTIPSGSVLTERMRINSTGNVGIGTIDTKGYKLAVNGGIIATAVKVQLYGEWADYVFNKDYKLPTLADVKDYIDKNHHLPDMPSAKEVVDNGLDLGEINKLLVKKVEELTLYLIEKDREITEFKAKRLIERDAENEEIKKMKVQLTLINAKLGLN